MSERGSSPSNGWAREKPQREGKPVGSFYGVER